MDAKITAIIDAETSKFKKALDDAKKHIKDFDKKSGDASKGVKQAFDKIKDGAKKAADTIKKHLPGAIDAAKKAFAGLTVAFGLVTKGTEQFRNEQAKLVSAFESAGSTAEAAKQVFNGLYRVLGEDDQAVEAANHIAQLTTNEKEMAEWTNICQGVYATFGASLPIEGLTEAANETAKVGQVTGSLADALNWAGISEDAFNEKLAACNTEAEREALIRTTLNGLYSEAAAKFEENNKAIIEQREAQAKLNETLATIGTTLTPLLTLFTQFANEALALVLPYIQDLAEWLIPKLQAGFEALPGVVEEVKAKYGEFKDKLEEAKKWLDDNETALTLLGVAIGTVTALVIAYNAQAILAALASAGETVAIYALIAAETAYSVVTGAATAVTTALGAAFTFLTSPIGLVIIAIGAAIAIGVLLYKNWDTIKQKAGELWQGITKTFDNIKKSIGEKIDGAKTKVKETIDKIKGFFNFQWSLPKLKMPHVKISGEFSLVPPKVPKFSIDWYAQGGVFDTPTLFPYGGRIGGLGEAGAEAIVPLEKNTQWLDKIADKLAARSGSTPIILQVDGKTFAQTAIGTINDLTRQTGKLQLNVY
jgi:phage-related minor tail protein